MRVQATLLCALLALALPVGSGGHPGAPCADPEGDTRDDAGTTRPDHGWIDIVGVRTVVEDGIVSVRVRYADDPNRYDATHSLTIDHKGTPDPDVMVRDDGGGSIDNVAVYWKAYPHVEGNEVVYVLSTSDEARPAFDGPRWRVIVGAFTYGAGGIVKDEVDCASEGAARRDSPAVGAVAALAVAGAALTRRR